MVAGVAVALSSGATTFLEGRLRHHQLALPKMAMAAPPPPTAPAMRPMPPELLDEADEGAEEGPVAAWYVICGGEGNQNTTGEGGNGGANASKGADTGTAAVTMVTEAAMVVPPVTCGFARFEASVLVNDAPLSVAARLEAVEDPDVAPRGGAIVYETKSDVDVCSIERRRPLEGAT